MRALVTCASSVLAVRPVCSIAFCVVVAAQAEDYSKKSRSIKCIGILLLLIIILAVILGVKNQPASK
jgi:hypothetical protein